MAKCMQMFCNKERWDHPDKGKLVLCQEHAEEVFRGEARPPPLRVNIDYVSVARKTLLPELGQLDDHESTDINNSRGEK